MFSAKNLGSAGRFATRVEHLYGGSLTDNEVSASAYVNLQFNSNGSVTTSGGTSYVSTIGGTWHDAFPTGSDYDIKVDVVSGDIPTGDSLGSWISLGTNRQWQTSSSLPGSGSAVTQCSLTISIRKAASLLVVASNTYTMYARSTFA